MIVFMARSQALKSEVVGSSRENWRWLVKGRRFRMAGLTVLPSCRSTSAMEWTLRNFRTRCNCNWVPMGMFFRMKRSDREISCSRVGRLWNRSLKKMLRLYLSEYCHRSLNQE